MPVGIRKECPIIHSDMHVLVTGGAGFLGHHLVTLLLDKGLSVTILDDMSTGSLQNIPRSPRVTVIPGSVLDPAAIKQAIIIEPDMIFHLAGIVGMRLAVQESDLAYRISVEGTYNILHYTGATPTVLYSSSAVYGLTQHNAVSESMASDETGALIYDGGVRGYASGKWGLELAGKKAMADGRKMIIVRPFNAVGPRQRANYGMVLPRFIRNAMLDKPLTIYDDGEQYRSFSCATTFTDCVYRLINQPDTWEDPCNVINIGTTELTTINTLADIVLSETGSESAIKYAPYNAVFPGKCDVQARGPDVTKMESLIGQVNWPSITHIVRKFIAYEQDMKTTYSPEQSTENRALAD